MRLKPSYEEPQLFLLQSARRKYELSDKVMKAFMELPRHRFIPKFYINPDVPIVVTEQNLEEHLSLLYSDYPVLLYDKKGYTCTISQPSFVLYMLDLLQLQEGEKVFELGAGSGWNAALMGKLVGPEGKVISLEIIPEMARQAQESVAQFDLPQVKIFQGDGSQGFSEEGPFDKGIFTAGARDLPLAFFDQIKNDGKLLFVLKTDLGDLLLLLRKKDYYFESITSMRCSFVPVTGEKVSKETDLSPLLRTSGQILIYPRNKDIASAQGKQVLLSSNCAYVY